LCSSTIRTARSRTSGENLLLVLFVMTPSSQELEPPANAGRFITVIGHTSDSVTRPIRVQGVLVGLDSKTKRFRFVDPNGDDYAGPLSETFPAGAVWQVNDVYVADIEVEETVEYATDTKKQINRLKHLESLSKS
ncbi:hypothetical protein, partial [Acidocella sp.]|uniref:hypothetical protein n=1 Tax=Acidocella sp. TaxID=50710 RepID=UPI002620753B